MPTVLTNFSYSEGEYGHRVRVFSRPGRKNLSVEFWDPTAQKMVVRSLEHADEELARRQCRNMSDAIRLRALDEGTSAIGLPAQSRSGEIAVVRNGAGPADQHRAGSPEIHAGRTAPSSSAHLEFIGWKELFRRYHEKQGKYKKGTGPREGQRRALIWTAYFRQKQLPDPSHLDKDEMLEFVRERQAGTLRTPFVELRSNVSKQTAWADIVFLVTVLRWATEAKDPRDRKKNLLASNSLKVPTGLKNKNPHRPKANHDDVLERRRVANSVDSQGLFRDYLRLVDEIGWRVTGMCNISAAEVCLQPGPDMPYGHIVKNPFVDKEGHGQRVPLSRRGAAIVRRILRKRGIEAGHDAWLFPAKRALGKPWSRWHVADLERRAEAVAQIPHLGGTHASRRKWATERKGHPVPDVMVAGGWTDPRSLDPYMQDDEKTTFEVISQPTRRIRRPRSVKSVG